MKKKLSIVLCLLMVICVATGCTTYNNFKNAFFSDNNADSVAKERTIKIGVYEPLTGKYKEQGNQEKRGIELANEMYPEVLGKKVELIYADNQSDMHVAETVIQELVSQNPSVILGSYGETLTLVAGDVVKANNIPSITITGTNPLITVNNPYYFSATYAEERQGDALAEYVFTAQGIDKTATVQVAGDDTVTPTVKRFTNRIKTLTENNESIAGSFELPAGSSDYTEVIEGIKKSGVKAVFMAVSPNVATEFLKQAEQARLTGVLFVGTKNWNDDKFISFVKKSSVLNVAYASDFSVDAQNTEISKEFVEAYKKKYGEDAEPTEAEALAFDSYIMALKAIENAYNDTVSKTAEEVEKGYSTDAAKKAAREEWETTQKTGIPAGRAIRAALSKLDEFEGASGTISYEGSNEAVKNVIVTRISGGRTQEAYIVD